MNIFVNAVQPQTDLWGKYSFDVSPDRGDHEYHCGRRVKIVFTSAGNPKTWTGWLKERDITVAHVVSSSKFAMKCEEAGVDAVVAEGFEAGGHNGREETTTLCLIPAVREATTLPLIAAGGLVPVRPSSPRWR